MTDTYTLLFDKNGIMYNNEAKQRLIDSISLINIVDNIEIVGAKHSQISIKAACAAVKRHELLLQNKDTNTYQRQISELYLPIVKTKIKAYLQRQLLINKVERLEHEETRLNATPNTAITAKTS